MKVGWKQNWRAPLRAALDFLRDDLAAPFELEAAKLLKDPWAARDAYIAVILDRSPDSLSNYFGRHAKHALSREEEIRALQLLEMERHALLMYTSCGWFFDELSGLETVQVIMYAGRALQLAQVIFQNGFEERFLERLREAPSNVDEYGEGAQIYQRWVKPSEVDLLKVGAHYAISSLFDRYERQSSIFCYNVVVESDSRSVSGRAQLALGRACIRSRITREQADVTYGVLHFGDHNISAGVCHFRSEEEFKKLQEDGSAAFKAADLPGTLRVLDRHFERVAYSLRSLFKDERRKVLREILRSTMDEVESAYRQIYEHHASLMDFFGEIGSPLPNVLRLTSEFVLNARMRRGFDVEDPIPVTELRSVLQTANRERVQLGMNGLPFVISRRLNRISAHLPADPEASTLDYLNEVIALVRELPFEVEISKLQDRCYEFLHSVYPVHAHEGEDEWTLRFTELCDRLQLRILQIQSEEQAPISAT